MARTLPAKVWEAHVVDRDEGGDDLLFVDLHLVHEVTSPQAFDGLRAAGRRVRRPDLTVAVEDHNVPTDSTLLQDPLGAEQIRALRRNCEEFGIELYRLGDDRQGIVHVTAPQLGLVQPGMVVVCGDSHTSTHGAFGGLGFGIGTSDVEHVLATQTVALPRPRTMEVVLDGRPPAGVTAKDLTLAVIARLGVGGAGGHLVEFRGEAVADLSMEGRMTLCNLSIEAGARAGMVAPDGVTEAFLAGLPFVDGDRYGDAVRAWRELTTDPGAAFDRSVRMEVSALAPQVTWGTTPGQTAGIDETVPDPNGLPAAEQEAARTALRYMDLRPGTPLREVAVDVVFLGSCTNSRVEDLRAAAGVLAGRRVVPGVRMLVVPGSMQVRRQAEAEGLDEVFTRAGAEWRRPGCSICLGMNPDRLSGGQRVASTSNRNFEGRQGPGVRTHLVSPAVAAATAVAGRLAAPSDLAAAPGLAASGGSGRWA